MPTTDHKIIAAEKKAENWFKATKFKTEAYVALATAAIIFIVALNTHIIISIIAIIPIIYAILMRVDAAKVYGPDYGDATGTARMGTSADIKEGGIFR